LADFSPGVAGYNLCIHGICGDAQPPLETTSRSRGHIAGRRTQEKDCQELQLTDGRRDMAESVYKIIEVVGTSTESWEKAAAAAVERASRTLRDLRIAEIEQLDLQLADGKVQAYRARVKLSFKFEE
jgi:dodecin